MFLPASLTERTNGNPMDIIGNPDCSSRSSIIMDYGRLPELYTEVSEKVPSSVCNLICDEIRGVEALGRVTVLELCIAAHESTSVPTRT